MSEELNGESACSISLCVKDENGKNFMMDCSECKRSLHYRCTRLPVYQLQSFIDLKKKRRKNNYRCQNCVDVEKDLHEHMMNNNENGNQTKDVEELTLQLAEISFENDKTKNQNKVLQTQQRKYKQLLRQGTLTQKNDQDSILKLNQEVKELEMKTKTYVEKEEELKNKISILQQELQEVQKPVSKVMNTLKFMFQELGEEICKEMRESHKERSY